MPAPDKLSGERALLRFIQRHDRLTVAEASRLENIVARTGESVFEVLERDASLGQAELAGLLARHLRLPHLDLASFPLDVEMGRIVKEALAVRHSIVPLRVKDRFIEVATANPLDAEAIRAVELATSRRVRLAVATFTEVREALGHIYRLEESPGHDLQEVPISEQLTIKELRDDSADLRMTMKDAELPPIGRLVDLILVEAIKSCASDVHIEPSPEAVTVRYRIDGVLEEHFTLPKWVQNPLMARLKALAKLDITERRLPQDGHIQARYREAMIDFHVSSLPVQHGEKITVQVSDRNSGVKAITDIGFSDIDLGRVRDAVTRPQGMILVTGPTGSGKTTTLYSFLREIWSPALDIVTIENSIEYEMRGVTQVEVNAKQGLTFASVIRSMLRQDPDVILLGEIRDSETARIAFQAAQSGHLVLSTVHTADAVATIARLLDLGIEPYTIASSLNLVVAQRLVRRICRQCQRPSDTPEETKRLLRLNESGIQVQRGSGCPECRQTGYRGRIGLFEVLPISPSIAQLIETSGPDSLIRRHARMQRVSTLQDDAMAKIAAGITTPDEILRVVQIDDRSADGDAKAVVSAPAPASKAVASLATPQPKTAAPPGVELPRRASKALVVDDDPDLRRIVRTMLERSGLGLTVITAQDGAEALALVEIERPDIIVLDVAMPGLDGFEVCRQLRADPHTENVPVVLLTARDAAEDVTRGFREGADDYVIKPFRGEELIARIRRMIQRTYGAPGEAPAETGPGATIVNPVRLSGGLR